uniref:Core-2/I-branching beta-1,6-N-acetylglucosaminyltransferase family protein n=1 Tax=Kalanchoe fedtschenkoi TaxID=63787 RepID=A0A7N0T994_KALFE
MISPTPFSLLCALMLCLPLAVFFNSSPTATPVTISAVDAPNSVEFSGEVVDAHLRPVSANFTDKLEVGLMQTVTRLNLGSRGDAGVAEEDEEGDGVGDSPLSPPPPSPPPIRVDYEDDYAKLAAAGMVDSRPRRPFKVAFMFLTTGALPFAPLWEAFFRHAPAKLYNVYVHADPLTNSSAFSGVFANKVIDSKPTRRYSPTLISAARRLLAHALLHDGANSHFALISASCIPLHSFKFTYKTLTSSRKSFIEILPNEPGAYERWSARGESAMLPDIPFEISRIGSQFWVLTRRHARTVVRDRRMWARFKQDCTRWYDCYPEESYFPTLLSVRDEKGCVPATLTHVDWGGRVDGHPRSYAVEEVDEELIRRLRSERPRYGDEAVTEEESVMGNVSDSGLAKRWHPFLFARKFEPEALGALMGIASGVILKD